VSTEVSKRGGRLPSIACGFHVEHPGHRQVQTSGPAAPSCSTATVSRESSWASPRVRTCGRQPSGIAAVRRETSDRTPRPATHAGDGPPARPSRPVHLRAIPETNRGLRERVSRVSRSPRVRPPNAGSEPRAHRHPQPERAVDVHPTRRTDGREGPDLRGARVEGGPGGKSLSAVLRSST
jgi:hypothetical protein